MDSYKIAVYLRLSKEDGDIGKPESNSISNQRILVLDYIRQYFPQSMISHIYIDDGWSGTNFDRPAFNEMMRDIHEGRADMVIVKDLSRFGRDYIDAGRYIKKEFRNLNIRFVSVMERFDSATATPSSYSLELPVRNFVNDQFSGDLSAKIRGSQSAMRRAGKYIGPFVGYGRRKDPQDKHRILIDEYAAGVIGRMVNALLCGYTVQKISEALNTRGIAAPADYKRQQGISYETGFLLAEHSSWSPQAVIRALSDPMNKGVMVQGKRRRISYKVRSMVHKPYEEQDVVVDAVPAIMSEDCYENVRRLLLCDMRTAPGLDRVYLFSGFLYCGDCGRGMIRRKLVNDVSYICASYNKKEGCSRHRVKACHLEELVLGVINAYVKAAAAPKDILEYKSPADDGGKYDEAEIERHYRELQRFKKLYAGLEMDKDINIISMEEYEEFQSYYGKRCEELNRRIEVLEHGKEEAANHRAEQQALMERFRRYGQLPELTRLMISVMMDRVIVYEDNRVELIFRYRDEWDESVRYMTIQEVGIKDGENQKS